MIVGCLKNRSLLETDPGSVPTAKMKPSYYSVVTRSSTLNVGRGPRPAFDYNGISENF